MVSLLTCVLMVLKLAGTVELAEDMHKKTVLLVALWVTCTMFQRFKELSGASGADGLNAQSVHGEYGRWHATLSRSSTELLGGFEVSGRVRVYSRYFFGKTTRDRNAKLPHVSGKGEETCETRLVFVRSCGGINSSVRPGVGGLCRAGVWEGGEFRSFVAGGGGGGVSQTYMSRIRASRLSTSQMSTLLPSLPPPHLQLCAIINAPRKESQVLSLPTQCPQATFFTAFTTLFSAPGSRMVLLESIFLCCFTAAFVFSEFENSRRPLTVELFPHIQPQSVRFPTIWHLKIQRPCLHSSCGSTRRTQGHLSFHLLNWITAGFHVNIISL